MQIWLFVIFVAYILARQTPFSAQKQKNAGIFIYLKDYSTSIYPNVNAFDLEIETITTPTTNAEKRWAVYRKKQRQAQLLQQNLLSDLQSLLPQVEYEPFWIVNAIYLPHSELQKLSFHFSYRQNRAGFFAQSEKVDFLDALMDHEHVLKYEWNEQVAETQPFEMLKDPPAPIDQEITWPLKQLNVEKAWSLSQGENIRVAIIDTGVDLRHKALQASYAGTLQSHDYTWFDPKEFRQDDWWCGFDDEKSLNVTSCPIYPLECCANEPFDIVGHGTHVMGSIVGNKSVEHQPAVGVAPKTKWIAAKGCIDGRCLRYGLLSSGQWVMCPTKLDGQDLDCSLGADVVSNSWGSQNALDDFYWPVVEAWREAGIIPVFANGNFGPNCGSAKAPGNFETVIGVGAVDEKGVLVPFSSRGPGPYQQEGEVKFGRQKPDFVAPGSKIYSTMGERLDSKFSNRYEFMSGTSMATPHLTGLVVLALSYYKKVNKKEASYEEIYQLLKQSVKECQYDFPLGGGGSRLPFGLWIRKQCDAKFHTECPNPFYGFGQVDAYKLLSQIKSF